MLRHSGLGDQAALFLWTQRSVGDGDLEDGSWDFLAAPAVILSVVFKALVAEAGAGEAVPAIVHDGDHAPGHRPLVARRLDDAEVSPLPLFLGCTVPPEGCFGNPRLPLLHLAGDSPQRYPPPASPL